MSNSPTERRIGSILHDGPPASSSSSFTSSPPTPPPRRSRRTGLRASAQEHGQFRVKGSGRPYTGRRSTNSSTRMGTFFLFGILAFLLLGEEAAAHAPWGGRRRSAAATAISGGRFTGADTALVSEVAFRSGTAPADATNTDQQQQQQQQQQQDSPLDQVVPTFLHKHREEASMKKKNKRRRQPRFTPPQRPKRKKSAIRQYHDAIQFLIPQETSVGEHPPPSQSRRHRTLQKQQPAEEGHSTKQKKEHLPTTRIGVLAQYFRPVLRTHHPHHHDRNSDNGMVIDMPHLLDACHRFERAMVAAGQTLAAKDLRNNLAKVEAFYRKQKHHHNHHNDMRRLLQLEQATNVHSRGPNGFTLLDEESCAMGLLWIRRSLQFQSRFYAYLLDPAMDPKRAALQAYAETLQSVHGWTLQKIHVLAFKAAAASDRRALLARLGGFEYDENESSKRAFGAAEEEAVQRDLRTLVNLWEPLVQRWEEIFDELDLEDQRRV